MRKILVPMLACILVFSGCIDDGQSTDEVAGEYNPVQIGADELFLPESLLPPKESVLDDYEGYPLGVDLPHHLPFARNLFYEFYQGLLARRPDISTFIILGPDHYERGRGISTMRDGFETPLGRIAVDQKIAGRLLHGEEVQLERDLFEDEHSIYVHLLYIQHFFPQARVVPIVFRSDVVLTDVQKMANDLSSELSDETFIICSTDLSHYLPELQSDVEDDQTIETLVDMEIERAEEVFADSPAAVTALLSMMQELGALQGTLLGRANSAGMGGDPASTTGYAVVVYTR